MQCDFSWAGAAEEYEKIYESITGIKNGIEEKAPAAAATT
jgi:hypothetical protein